MLTRFCTGFLLCAAALAFFTTVVFALAAVAKLLGMPFALALCFLVGLMYACYPHDDSAPDVGSGQPAESGEPPVLEPNPNVLDYMDGCATDCSPHSFDAFVCAHCSYTDGQQWETCPRCERSSSD